MNPPSLTVFDLLGRATKKPTMQWLDDNEFYAVKQWFLRNCVEIQPTLRYVLFMLFFCHIFLLCNLMVTLIEKYIFRDFRNFYGDEAIREYFSIWFKDYVSGHNIANIYYAIFVPLLEIIL